MNGDEKVEMSVEVNKCMSCDCSPAVENEWGEVLKARM